MSRIRLRDYSKLIVIWKSEKDVTIFWNDVISNFFNVVLFFLSSLVISPSFMSISWMVLELWQFPFIRDWPEIRKSEILSSEFFPISGDNGELGIPNFARRSLIKCYWMLQKPRVTAFTISALLRENQQGGKVTPHPPPRLGSIFLKVQSMMDIKGILFHWFTNFWYFFQVRVLPTYNK